MVDLIRVKDSRYGGKQKAGDAFTATPGQARVLVALGEARYAPKTKKAEPKQPEARPTLRVKGTYQRRDMQAIPTVQPVEPAKYVPAIGRKTT